MGLFGLGRPRSRFGKWMEQNGIRQAELERLSGVSQATISDLARDDDRTPSWRTEKKLIQALRCYDAEISAEDFWG